MAAPVEIRSTTVNADVTRPFLKMNTRYNYIKGYMPFWKERHRFRAYVITLALAGIYFLFTAPILAAAAFAGAMYFWQLYDHRGFVVGSGRQVLIAK